MRNLQPLGNISSGAVFHLKKGYLPCFECVFLQRCFSPHRQLPLTTIPADRMGCLCFSSEWYHRDLQEPTSDQLAVSTIAATTVWEFLGNTAIRRFEPTCTALARIRDSRCFAAWQPTADIAWSVCLVVPTETKGTEPITRNLKTKKRRSANR